MLFSNVKANLCRRMARSKSSQLEDLFNYLVRNDLYTVIITRIEINSVVLISAL